MHLFEARNNYELLVSLVLAFCQDQNVAILTHRKDLVDDFNVKFYSVDFGRDLKSKLKFYKNWNRFADADTASVFHEISPLLKNSNIKKKIIIQHGEICYLSGWQLMKIAGILYFLRKTIYMEPFFVGSGRDINEVWLRDIEKAPPGLLKKAKKFNLSDFYKNLIPKQCELINKIFLYPTDLPDLSGFDILITQPLSEFGIVSEERKLDIYSSILEKYESVLIKPHPAETTNYQKLFNVPVLNPQTPIELFSLNQVKFGRALTLYSSGIESILCDETIRFGTSAFPDLVKKIGLIV